MSGLSAMVMLMGNNYAAATSHKNFAAENARRVDFHAHAILPSYIDGMEGLGIDPVREEGYPLPKWSREAHLEFMDEAGIDYSVLSMPTPHLFCDDERRYVRAARNVNEDFAKLCRDNPDKFGFAATLPLPSVKGSLAEIRYAFDELGAVGVKIASNSGGIYLGDKRLEEIFAALDERNALVILHPSPARTLPRENVVTGRVMALFEYPADTTRAVLNLLASGTLERCPRIRFVVPHCGSFLPYMKQRAKAMFAVLADLGMMKPANVEEGLKNLYFDLAGDPMPEEMDMLLKITGSDRIVYGSDYPYVAAPILLRKKIMLDEELARRGRLQKIYADNAAKLLYR